MATTSEGISCGSFVFYNNFDSANLAKVEQVKVVEGTDNDGREVEGKSCKSSGSDEIDYEFNVWTKHDCHGTEYQNNNRTWFYFGIKAGAQGIYVKLNVINLNKQVKMFSQGMCPVYKIIPGHPHWERIREKPTYTLDQKESEFTLSFTYRTSENPKAITYFAFTYPFTYTDLQCYLKKVDLKISKRNAAAADDIYYFRECAIKSLEGRRLDLLTISSYYNISTERESRLKNMFPEKNEERPFKFKDKKVIFLSARVHPGETPSSFVFNGFLNLLLNREDPMAINLRRLYVFKLIPMLNPDGVARGHYRMDTRGVNLNRVYLNPSIKDHPTIYAARTLIRYYHYSYNLPEEIEPGKEITNINVNVSKNNEKSIASTIESTTSVAGVASSNLLQQVTLMTLNEKGKGESESNKEYKRLEGLSENYTLDARCRIIVILNLNCDMHHAVDFIIHVLPLEESKEGELAGEKEKIVTSGDARNKEICTTLGIEKCSVDPERSGLFLYIDLHGHASKKGVFMYGNYFDDSEDTIMCLLLPKLMSINNPNFHFTSCNFAERNMYLIDKRDGMSREGSGRVAVYKLTGLVRSYTLECNYNSGRLVNSIPARIRDGTNKTQAQMFVPPKYTPAVFEEVGAALGPSILDLTNNNPNSRLPNSQYRSLRGVKSYLKLNYVNNFPASFNKPLNKSNSGLNVPETLPTKITESKLSCTSGQDGSNPMKSESNIINKPCKIRRSMSLYTTVKRINGNKSSRQITSRKPLKSQVVNNIENNSVTSAVRLPPIGAKKKFFKSSNLHYSPVSTNLKSIGSASVPKIKGYKQPSRKLTINEIVKQTTVNTEETTIVKQGSKRLKVVSPKLLKTRPEIGESSKTLIAGKMASKTAVRALFSCNKQNVKGIFGKTKKQHIKIEQTKLKKSSKLKVKSRNIMTTSSSSCDSEIITEVLN